MEKLKKEIEARLAEIYKEDFAMGLCGDLRDLMTDLESSTGEQRCDCVRFMDNYNPTDNLVSAAGSASAYKEVLKLIKGLEQ